jgi:AraC family transcriptional regulator
MKIQIVMFPETKLAAIEHYGSPSSEHDTARKLIAWKLEQKLLDPAKYRSYGVHYTDPRTTRPSDHHVDFCLSIDRDVEPNAFGIVNKIIPRNRCALARDIGSRYNIGSGVSIRRMAASERGDTGRLPDLRSLGQRRPEYQRGRYGYRRVFTATLTCDPLLSH